MGGFRNYSRYNGLGYSPTFSNVNSTMQDNTQSTLQNEYKEIIETKKSEENLYPADLVEDESTYAENNDTQENEEQKEKSTNNKESDTSKRSSFRFGPIGYSNNTLNIFGFELALDDLIILALIFILLLDSDNNYPLIIVLGLMFFNINLSNVLNFKI